MISKTTRLSGCLALLIGASGVAADTVKFGMIPDVLGANDITPDGRFIVGDVSVTGGTYRYDTVIREMTILPPEAINAVAVSDDGSTVLGTMIHPVTGDQVAGMWTETSGVWTSLGFLPNAGACPGRSSGYELSADGQVAVGLSWDGCSGRAFRWTQATGMVELEPLANGGNRASVVSADGNVMAGFAQGSFSRTPALWNGSGDGQLLDPPNGDVVGEITAINDAGTLLLGTWDGQASRWSVPDLNRTVIGGGSIIPGWQGVPQDIADDGTMVGFDILGQNRRAWIVPPGQSSMVDLKTYIESNGGIVPPGLTLEVAQAITADGTTIIGHGNFTGAWYVTIIRSESCTADIDGNDAVDVTDLLAVLAAWGPCPQPCPPSCDADIDENCTVDVVDLLALLAAWGPCPPSVGACCLETGCTQLSEVDCADAGGQFLGVDVPCTPFACQSNDDCSDAVDITSHIDGDLVYGDNSAATPGFGMGADADLPAGSPSCHFSGNVTAAHSTVWYLFQAPKSGEIVIETCLSQGAFNDSTIALFSGECGALTEIACGEDECPVPGQAPYYSRITKSGLTPGQTYYVAVMNPGDWFGSVPGPFVVSISTP